MRKHYPAPLIALLALVLPVGLTACQGGDKTPNAQESAAQGNADNPFDKPKPTEFDESKIEPDGVQSADGQVVKDFKKWTLPTDPYNNEDDNHGSTAHDIHLYKCLASKNVSVPKPDTKIIPKKPPHPDISVALHAPVFTVENASKYAYSGSYELIQDNLPDNQQFYSAIQEIRDIAEELIEEEGEDGVSSGRIEVNSEKAKDPRYKALAECEDSAFDDLKFLHEDFNEDPQKEPNFEDYLKESPLTAMEYYSGQETPIVKKSIEEWKTCMRPLGIPDLPDNPFEMPTQSLSDKWFANYSESTEFKPTPAEFEVAKKDAECRESSKFLRNSYDVQWAFLNEHVKKYQKDLQEDKKRRDEIEQKTLEYIKANQ